jgi:hypothetical protein
MSNKITFHSNRLYNIISEDYHPKPTKNLTPEWFKQADKFELNKQTGEYWPNTEGGFVRSFKSCPGLLDIFITGYFYVTPCDIVFSKLSNGDMIATPEPGYEDFVGARAPMNEFPVPHGYLDRHFHWYPNWAPEVPEGYSVLYVNPINRFDLPFITTSAIIDNDKMNTPGLIPFFLRDDFEGKIPKGTPYLQLIPYKREDWKMDPKFHDMASLQERHNAQAKKFRTKDGGAYKQTVRSLKKYE